MQNDTGNDQIIEIDGVIDRITYQNEDNGFTIAHVTPRGKNYEITVTGNMSGIHSGTTIHLSGKWVTHPQYGRQLSLLKYQILLPSTVEGIRKYLGSGLIKGVGPVTASRIVDFFGTSTLDIIEKEPTKLNNIPGIGSKRVNWIISAWQEQKIIKEVMIFLQGHDVNASLAVKIFKHYGAQSIDVVNYDPYRLAKDIFGIGFKTADKIALKLGKKPDDPIRIQAGLMYSLGKLSEEGHCYATEDQLVTSSSDILGISIDLCKNQLDTLIRQEDVIVEEGHYFLPPFFYAEIGVANKLRQLTTRTNDRLSFFKDEDWDRIQQWLDQNSQIHLTPNQKQAIQTSFTNKVSIITGGPGTGKSTITASIIKVLSLKSSSVLLAAPTGRAAKRLSEATGIEAKTIHRLLEFSPMANNAFLRDRSNPLDSDLIIIDEVSMVDILLMNHLLNAIPLGSHLVLVGDADQLPSVGPGNVLHDLIDSKTIPVTCLDTIFRQSPTSYITLNAHRINQGITPLFEKESSDFFLFPEQEPEKAAERLIEVVTKRIPDKFGLDPDKDIQVLCPMHRGKTGVIELNQRLQQELNKPGPNKSEYFHGSRLFREGDRVMQTRNDYNRLVFNGDLGNIINIDLENQSITIMFDGRTISYDYSLLDELQHAYAISIHKSQGAEFPAVVIPFLTQNYMMLQRNLLYTAVTRGRKLVVLVGSKRAIAIATKNNSIIRRQTHLVNRLNNLK